MLFQRFPLLSAALTFFALAAPASLSAQTLSVTDFTEGMTTTIEVSGCAQGDVVQLAYSFTGGGPVTTIYGPAFVSPPIQLPPTIMANRSGVASMSAHVPMGLAGVPVWFHAANLMSGTLTNPLAEVIGSNSNSWVQIPAGNFRMGDHHGVGASDERPIHTVTLDTFRMDVYEVTNELYAAFLNDAYAAGTVTVNADVVYQVGGAGEALCDTTASSNYNSCITWNGSTFVVTSGKDQHPMVAISWYGACAYANWRSEQQGLTPCYNPSTWDCDFNVDGWRLPTEAEWEYAARGGAHNPYYQYPWNRNNINSGDANYNYDINSTCEVGNYAPNGFGLYDTAGNVSEWCNDRYDDYSSSAQTNPTGPSSGSRRLLRGGAWRSWKKYVRSAERGNSVPSNRYNDYNGFRLASAQ